MNRSCATSLAAAILALGGFLLAALGGGLGSGDGAVSGDGGSDPPPGGEWEEDRAACREAWPEAPMNGVSLVAPRRAVGPEVIEPMLRVGTEWVGLLPYGFLDADRDRVRYDEGRQWWGERPQGLRATVEFARRHDLRVMMKPHLWSRGAGWVGDYAPATEEGWRRWEESYARVVVRLAALSDSLGVEVFVVGTELDETVRRRPAFWSDLIRRVRQVYGGMVTYAANWDGVHDVPFWDDLDLIGVNAYFPLSSAPTPSVANLEDAWIEEVEALAELCRRHGRPVFFPEFGYRSIDGAAGEQWALPPERRNGVPPNFEAQTRAYEALFRMWWNRPWFAGGFLWKWFGNDDAGQGPRADYTPQHKPVERVIRRWYLGAGAPHEP